MAAQFRFGCAICSEAFDNHQTVCAAICGHIYHATCLGRWVMTQVRSLRPPTCPKCRASIRRQHLRRLFLHQVDVTPVNSPQANDADTVIVANETDSDADTIDAYSEDTVSVAASDDDEETNFSEDTISVASDNDATTEEEDETAMMNEIVNADFPLFLALIRRRQPDFGSYMHSLSALDADLNTTLNEVEDMSFAVDGLWNSIHNRRDDFWRDLFD